MTTVAVQRHDNFIEGLQMYINIQLSGYFIKGKELHYDLAE
jgi:hypothetical protein